MKKLYIFMIALFLVNGACQKSQFSTTTRHTNNGRVTYTNNYRFERSTSFGKFRYRSHVNKKELQNNKAAVIKDERFSGEPGSVNINPAPIPLKENLLASNSIQPGIIAKIENRQASENNRNFLHRENRLPASGRLLSSILNNKSNYKSTPPSTRPKVETNGLMGFIFSILGFIPLIGIFFSLAGIIFSSISLYKFKHDQRYYSGKGLAIAGLILGIISLIANTVLIIALIVDMSNFSIGGGISVI